MVAGQEHWFSRFLLARKHLFPRPWLLRKDYISEKPAGLIECSVDAIALEPNLAANFLLGLPVHPPRALLC